MKDHHESLQELGEALRPTRDEVAALIDGSLEAERDAPETHLLLTELPSPTSGDVKALKSAVIDAMDTPRARRVPFWLPITAVVAAILGASALLLF